LSEYIVCGNVLNCIFLIKSYFTHLHSKKRQSMHKKKSILIVDDEESSASGMATVLSKQGYKTEVSFSGDDALEALSGGKFDLVISGLLMKGIHGHGILSKVRATSPGTPVIVLAGFASVKSAVEALRLGAYDYLIKPCEDAELLLRVKRALEKAEMERQLVEAQKKSMFSATVITANHEINQPLTTIYGAVGLIEMELEEQKFFNNVVSSQLRNIFVSAQRISGILQRMKKISKPILKTYAHNVKMIQLGEVAAPEPLQAPVHKVKHKAGEDHTILIVDDEQPIRDLIESALSKMRYNCLSAPDAAGALKIFEKQHSDICLVITDIKMPKVSGKELYYRLKEIDPDIRIILSSGYDVDVDIRELMKRGAAGFLQKPFSVQELTTSVKKALS